MKVYVDELPKRCVDCPLYDRDDAYGSICNLGAYDGYWYKGFDPKLNTHIDCPLQLLPNDVLNKMQELEKEQSDVKD